MNTMEICDHLYNHDNDLYIDYNAKMIYCKISDYLKYLDDVDVPACDNFPAFRSHVMPLPDFSRYPYQPSVIERVIKWFF